MNDQTKPSWPVLDGSYVVGDPSGPVAVCTLTSETLVEPLAQLPGVAIAGKVYTANLGLERIVVNVTANPAIRFLLLCGKDSKLFRPGQSLSALMDNGIDGEGRIVGAEGYAPVLAKLPPARLDLFRRQVELVERIGEDDLDTLRDHIDDLAHRAPDRPLDELPAADLQALETSEQENFLPIRPGGRREPLQYDSKGFFVITLDREEDQVVVRHYLPDNSPAHEMRGQVAESMLLGLLREGLISQLSHAGYLGAELAKAEAALHLDLRYDQDRPLRRMPQPVPPAPGAGETSAEAPPTAAPPAPQVPVPFTLEEYLAAKEGDEVLVTLEIVDQPSPSGFEAQFLQPEEQNPFSSFRRTDRRLTVSTARDTKHIMGGPEDVVTGALVRVRGPVRPGDRVETETLVILTRVATVQ